MLSTLQDEASSKEEREAEEYDGGLELVIPFLTFLKEMPGFIFFAVNSTPLCWKCTCSQVVGFSMPTSPTVKSSTLESYFYRSVRMVSVIFKMTGDISFKGTVSFEFYRGPWVVTSPSH